MGGCLLFLSPIADNASFAWKNDIFFFAVPVPQDFLIRKADVGAAQVSNQHRYDKEASAP